MPFILRITTRPLYWSDRKLQEMERDIVLMLAQEGAPNSTVEVLDEHGNAPAPPEPPTYLHLKCTACDVQWYDQQFAPCPRCGAKVTVHKATIKRVVLPEGAALGREHARPIEAVTS